MRSRSAKPTAGSGNGRNIGMSGSIDSRRRYNATRRRPTMAEALAMSAQIERTAPDTIRLERTLDAPIETVWRYLTEADLRRDWFMGGTDARADAEFELVIDH